MSVRNDQVNVTVEIDGKQAISNLGKLELSAKDIATELKGMKKGTDDYINTSKKLDNVNADIKKLRTEMGTAGMTVNQLKNYQRELNRELNNITIGTTRYNELKGKLNEVNGTLAQTKNSVKAVSNEAKEGGGFMTSFMGNFAANAAGQALSMITDFGKKAWEANQFQKEANAQVEASLKSTGGAAGVTKADIDALTASMQKKLNIDDDVIKNSASLLLTFTNIKKGVFEEALPAITDMAAKMDGDLKGASIQVGKALNDPIKGISALSKVGVSFTDEQKAVIKSLQETGDMAGAQKIILAELNKEFAGSAQAAADAKGPIDKFNITFGDLQEVIGAGMDNASGGFIEAGTGILEFMIELINESEPVVEVFHSIWDVLKELWNSFTDLVSAIMPATEGMNGASIVMKVLATVLATVSNGLKIAGLYITYQIDLWRTLINTGKEVANFFGAELKIDPTATLDAANAKLKTGIKNIATTYVDIWTDSDKEVIESGDAVVKEKTKQEQAITEAQKKEADKRQKAYEKEVADLTKEWQKLGADVAAIKEGNYLATLSTQEKEIATTNAHYDKLLDTVTENEKRLLELKLITQEQYDARIAEIEALRVQAVGKIIVDSNNAKLLEQDRINTELDGLRMSAQEKELLATTEYFDKLKEAAEKNNLDTTRIESERSISLDEIKTKYRKKATADALEADKKELEAQRAKYTAVASMLSSFASLSAATNALISNNSEKQSDFSKILTLAQIAIDTASAISSTISGAMASTNPIAAAAIIAAGLATVFTNMSTAKNLLSTAKTPSAPSYDSTPAVSSSTPVAIPKGNNMGAYAHGGFTDIGTVSGGGYVSKPSIATFGEVGEEWVMPNWMLTNPRMANLVGVLEGVRMRGFADGGFTNAPIVTSSAPAALATSGNNELMMQLIASVNALRGDVRSQHSALRAFVVYSDITDAEDTLVDIKNEASI